MASDAVQTAVCAAWVVVDSWAAEIWGHRQGAGLACWGAAAAAAAWVSGGTDAVRQEQGVGDRPVAASMALVQVWVPFWVVVVQALGVQDVSVDTESLVLADVVSAEVD